MSKTLIGCARCSTDHQDWAAQCAARIALGADRKRLSTDHRRTGTERFGNTAVVPNLDRFTRSGADARHTAHALFARGVTLALRKRRYAPADPRGNLVPNVLAPVADFAANVIRMPSREGMALPRAKRQLRDKQPTRLEKQQKELGRMHGTGNDAMRDLAEVFPRSRPLVSRTRARVAAAT